MNEVSLNLLKAGMMIIFLLLADFVIEFLLVKKVKSPQKSIKLRVMLRYALFFCFVFFMAKIWVEGFGYLLTFIGVISAALTITQKEYLMNFFGWLIIMWRHLFSEGDYIEIGQYRGYVEDIGPLSFTLAQASEAQWGSKTGKIVKLPNSLIAVNPITKYPSEATVVEGKLVFIFQFKSSVEKIQQLAAKIEQTLQTILPSMNGDQTSHSLFPVQSRLKVFQDKPSGIKLEIQYFSLLQEQKRIEETVIMEVTKAVAAEPELDFSIAT